MIDLLTPMLEQSVHRHGIGIVLTALEGLAKAHAVNFEAARHGIFAKMHFAKDKPDSVHVRRTLVLDDLVVRPRVLQPAPVAAPPTPPMQQNACMQSPSRVLCCHGLDPLQVQDPWYGKSDKIADATLLEYCGSDSWAGWVPSTPSHQDYEVRHAQEGLNADEEQKEAPDIKACIPEDPNVDEEGRIHAGGDESDEFVADARESNLEGDENDIRDSAEE